MIAAIKSGEAEEAVEEEVVEEEMSGTAAPKKVVESNVVETHFSDEQKNELVEAILSSVTPLIEELQNKVNELEAKLSSEEEVVEQKLSKTFKHTPEVKGEQKKTKLNNANVGNTTLQRVFQRMAK
jgi:hypothetical protein